MRKILFVPALMIIGMVACNDAATDKTAEGTDTTSTSAHDSGHAHTMDTTQAIAPLPAIPEGAKVYFKNLKDGQTLASPFKVEMGADNIAVDTIGSVKQASGHHHILIGIDSIPAGQVVPKDSTHIHFGNAQKEAELNLPPGKHKISLQFADGIQNACY